MTIQQINYNEYNQIDKSMSIDISVMINMKCGQTRMAIQIEELKRIGLVKCQRKKIIRSYRSLSVENHKVTSCPKSPWVTWRYHLVRGIKESGSDSYQTPA